MTPTLTALIIAFGMLALAAWRSARKVNGYGTNKHNAPHYNPNRHGLP